MWDTPVASGIKSLKDQQSVCLSLTLNRSLELFPKVLSAVAAKDSIPMVGGKKINFLNK